MSKPTITEYVGGNSEIKTVAKWWTTKPTEMSGHVFGVFRQIEANQIYRRQMNNNFARMYGNMPPVALGINPYNVRAQQDILLSNRLTLNVVKSCIDTAASKIATMKPRPFFLTNGGNYSQQRRAKKLTDFFEGMYDQIDLYEKKMQQFVDACIFGSGFIKYYIDDVDKCIKAERVLSDEVMVDDTEGLYDKPRQIFQKKLVSREVLFDMFPKHRHAIMTAAQASIGETGATTKADLVPVVEAWHLPSSKKAKDGLHGIFLDGATLFTEPYTKMYFPISKYSWNKRPYGYYGCGMAEDLIGIQLDINKTLRTIQVAQHLLAVPRIWVENSSQVVTSHLNNDIGAIGKFTGTPPIFSTPNAVSPELYAHVETQKQRAYEIVGISQLSAAAQKPTGLNSAISLRTYQDIETERFKMQAMIFEQSFMDDTEILIDLCDELSKMDGATAFVKAEKGNTMDVISWKEVKLDEADYILRKFPTSFLPSTPEGKLETVQELLNAGLIQQDHALSMLDFPDLKSVTSLINSSRDVIMMIIELIIDKGEYETPEPYFNLQLAGELSQNAYLKSKLDGVPEDRQELLRIFMQDVMAMMQASTPAPSLVPPEQQVQAGAMQDSNALPPLPQDINSTTQPLPPEMA
jgi:hypothetical protein